MSHHIKEDHFKDADSLLSLLRRSHGRWRGDINSQWVFRGQPDASHGLTPAAWRDQIGPPKPYLKVLIQFERVFAAEKHEPSDLISALTRRTWAEAKVVETFLNLLDQIGLPTLSFEPPPDDVELNERWKDAPLLQQTIDQSDIKWKHLSTQRIALAQHHGVPTRLLDWTYNPLVAAYFAAEGVGTSPGDKGNIAIWATRFKDSEDRIAWVHCSRAENEFIRSQQGVLSLVPTALLEDDFLKSGRWPDHAEYLDPQLTHKLTLPRSEAEKLVKLLFMDSVSLAHLMPTRENVAVTTKWVVEREAERLTELQKCLRS